MGGTFVNKSYDQGKLVSSKYITAFSDFRLPERCVCVLSLSLSVRACVLLPPVRIFAELSSYCAYFDQVKWSHPMHTSRTVPPPPPPLNTHTHTHTHTQ